MMGWYQLTDQDNRKQTNWLLQNNTGIFWFIGFRVRKCQHYMLVAFIVYIFDVLLVYQVLYHWRRHDTFYEACIRLPVWQRNCIPVRARLSELSVQRAERTDRIWYIPWACSHEALARIIARSHAVSRRRYRAYKWSCRPIIRWVYLQGWWRCAC